MSQLNNFSPPLPACWGGSASREPLCSDCIQAGAKPNYPEYMTAYSSQTSTQSAARSTISHSSSASIPCASHSIPDDSGESELSDSFGSTQYASSSGSSASSDPKAVAFAQALCDYTPPTVPNSLGHTPPPMATPPQLSFSNHLAYIDAKLLEVVAAQREADGINHNIEFPSGLTLHRGSKRAAPLDFFVQVEQGRSLVSHLFSSQVTGPRRTRSKIVQNEPSPPMTEQQTVGQFEGQHDAKRRKLRQHDSTASAHTFAATEPASLRKARSLVAGNVNEVQPPAAIVDPFHMSIPPFAVPTIWSGDAALARLRRLLEREGNQRAEDAHLKTMAQQPSSLKFDAGMHFGVTNWLFSVQGSAGDMYKPIRRHLRSSPETRFHAVLLFSRYATRLSCTEFNPFLKPRCGYEGAYQRRFHRDFLPPLLPLTADQFLDLLGDAHPVTFDDLELVQNTIMRSFNYILNQPTPQAYLQEFWMACPTLQSIQDGNLELHRTAAQNQVFELLDACLLEYKGIDYPVAYLTAGALLETLHLRELHQQCNVHSEGRFYDDGPTDSNPSRIRVCAACVNVEICAAMQVHSNVLTECRDWIMTTWIGGMDE